MYVYVYETIKYIHFQWNIILYILGDAYQRFSNGIEYVYYP